MADVVLVHGAWQGSWCWERLLPLLDAAGHRVTTPTLTGSGARADELTAEVTLDHHVRDVLDVVDQVDVDDLLLVGHSYGGMVISVVAERVPDRVRGLVYLDAFYPHDGESALDQMPEQFRAMFRQRAADEGDGWRLPANDGLLDVWGLHDQEDREWVRTRLTDWSLPCFESPAQLPARHLASVPRTFVAGAAEDYPARVAFGALAARAVGDGCRGLELPTGHDLMIEAPEELAQILDDAAK